MRKKAHPSPMYARFDADTKVMFNRQRRRCISMKEVTGD
jgi:hypothetical protein